MLQINFDQPQFKSALLRSAFLLIFFLSGIVVNAQTFSSTSPYRVGEQPLSTQQQQSYQSYQSTVYDPFDNTLPSAVGTNVSEQEFDVTGRRNLSGGGDPGTQGGSPVGEPWVLLFFAAAAALVVALKRKKQSVEA